MSSSQEPQSPPIPKPDFVLLGSPVIKKNGRPVLINRATGKPFIGKSEALRTAEEAAIIDLRNQCFDVSEPLPVPYRVTIKFLFYRSTHIEADLSNLYEFPQDCLQAAGILKNDHLVESHDGSRKLYDKENPRTEIYIERYTGENCSSPPEENERI